ncbi:hypothetical protein AB6A40_008122 [Gnathostoma spinigerum]|uniref:Sulfotransferase domain-containing protein n=1 Tax=Gnathostoma spinigerum TaxID=75299 RepID=A0ABD6EN78_9BILA
MDHVRTARPALVGGCIILSVVVIINTTIMSIRVTTESVVSQAPLINTYDDEDSAGTSTRLIQQAAISQRFQRLPQCLIIGARKGGTRALLDALSLHSQIRIVHHEMHFFNSNETYAKGLEWYRSQMPHTSEEQVTIEKTPGYYTNEYAPQRAYQMNSSLKLILIVRDPVIRVISDFTQVLYTKQDRNKSRPVFEDEVFINGSNRINIDYKPVRNSLYAIHMQQWLKYFPLSSFLILDGDIFIHNPLSQLKQVERFLGLPPEINESQLVFNRHKGFFCFRRRGRRTAKCLGHTKGRAHVYVSKYSQHRLRVKLRPHNRKFYHLVNRWWNWD